jgi:hypothetical protein
MVFANPNPLFGQQPEEMKKPHKDLLTKKSGKKSFLPD